MLESTQRRVDRGSSRPAYGAVRGAFARCAHFFSSNLRLPHVANPTVFRWSLGIAGVFVVCGLMLLAFIYTRTSAFITTNADALLLEELRVFVDNPQSQRLAEIEDRLRKDPRHIKVAGLFGVDGHRIAGNMENLPRALSMDKPTDALVTRLEPAHIATQSVRLVAHALPNGDILVIGQNLDEISMFGSVVGMALTLGLPLALALGIGIGVILSLRAHVHLTAVDRKIQRIAAGDLHERLPTHGRADPLDQLSGSVNRMLGEIEQLMQGVAGVGENIAHDLRTPLTRVRLRLERGRDHAATVDDFRGVVDQAISGLDHSLTTITAMLRIAQIEHSRRFDGFGRVDLASLLREVADLYEPVAEDKQIGLEVDVADGGTICGDRDLLFEAVANLVTNAVKFTPEGGRVSLALLRRADAVVIRVQDTGPGIPDQERTAVTTRFYRSERAPQTDGIGLGLSLVVAIAKLHEFQFRITGGPGCTAEIIAQKQNSTHCA
jgi:signal transduction histidine kinase